MCATTRQKIMEFVNEQEGKCTTVTEVITHCRAATGVVDLETTRASLVSLIDEGQLDYRVQGFVSLAR